MSNPATQPDPRPITPEQLLKARAALGLSLERLAARCNATAYGIATYERSGRVAAKRGQRHDYDVLRAIRVALESAGVEFTEEDGRGAGVRLRKATT